MHQSRIREYLLLYADCNQLCRAVVLPCGHKTNVQLCVCLPSVGCLCICLSVACLFVCLSICLSVCCLSICLSVCLCIYVSTDLADNSLSGVECTAHHPGSRGVADIVTVTMPLLSIYDLAVAISTRAGPAEDDPMLYKSGSKQVQAVCKGESGALN